MIAMKKFLKLCHILILIPFFFFLTYCGGWNPAPSRETPTGGIERAKKNVREGRGVTLGKVFGPGGSTNYEFSTSNPMWRAAFDVIDFMPLVTVDYSGGTIITDWYTDKKAPNESLKFTIRFLSSEIRADSVRVIIHRKVCQQKTNCVVSKISSKLENEIRTAIVKKAARLDRFRDVPDKKEKKKKKGFFNFGKGRSIEELKELDKQQNAESGKKR